MATTNKLLRKKKGTGRGKGDGGGISFYRAVSSNYPHKPSHTSRVSPNLRVLQFNQITIYRVRYDERVEIKCNTNDAVNSDGTAGTFKHTAHPRKNHLKEDAPPPIFFTSDSLIENLHKVMIQITFIRSPRHRV